MNVNIQILYQTVRCEADRLNIIRLAKIYASKFKILIQIKRNLKISGLDDNSNLTKIILFSI